jgi:hypothetical protein
MRTILLESKDPNETEIRVELIKRTSDWTHLIELGMSVKQLVQKGSHEFLSPMGVQYKATLLDYGTYINANGGNA